MAGVLNLKVNEPIDWQLTCTEVKQRGAHLFRSRLWSDCKFLVGVDPKQEFVAHKLLLAIASPVFEAMFYGQFTEVNDLDILIPDVHPDAFKAMIEYIYSDNVNITSFNHASDLYYAAKKYMLPHLLTACLTYMMSNVQPHNACRGYELAQLFEEEKLQDDCLEIIRSKTQDVIDDSSFLDADLKTVIKIFSLDPLNVDNELELFEAAKLYFAFMAFAAMDIRETVISKGNTSEEHVNILSKQEESDIANLFADADLTEPDQSKTKKSSDQLVPEQRQSEGDKRTKDSNKQLTIRDVLAQIRFLTMTPEQLAFGVAKTSLLTESETLAIFLNISDSNTDVPMPDGLSTSREQRNQYENAKYDEQRPHATIKLSIPDFRNLKDYILTPATYIRGLPWRIKIVPECSESIKFLGIYLICDWGSGVPGQSFVEAELRLISYLPKSKAFAKEIEHTFTRSATSKGLPKFISWEEVLNPKNGYLRNGAITIEALVVPTKVF